MRKLAIAAAAAFAFAGLAACGESAADKQADALEEQAEQAPTEAQADALNAEADRVEQQGGNADGGMTTENMPNTSPSTMPPAQ